MKVYILVICYIVGHHLCAHRISSKCVPAVDPNSSTIATTSNVTEEDGLLSVDVQECYRGTCIAGQCSCDTGWIGEYCDRCNGRVLLEADSGYVSDGPNNYTISMECSWLIQPTSRNALIRLKFLEFATECGWDYLYIYDGDSLYSPLLATFNGLVLIQDNNASKQYYPEVVATSGSVFLHFFSDIAYTMNGFNISYSVDACPQDCSSHGTCKAAGSSVTCECDDGWTGNACQFASCPANCTFTSDQGSCMKDSSGDELRCDCNSGYQGLDCAHSIPSSQGYWTEQSEEASELNTARSSHASVIVNRSMWVYGGIQYKNLTNTANLMKFDLESNEWSIVDTESPVTPTPRYGHSLISFPEKLILFGGRDVTSNQTLDEVWEFNTTGNTWNEVAYTTNFWEPTNTSTTSPLALWGHTGTLVDFENGTSIMVVLFGYHPILEYSGFVYEYDISGKSWSIATTSGAFIEASYGHSATWDADNKVIYIHGGITFLKADTYGVSGSTYLYDPLNRSFRTLRPSPVPRYLHTGVILDGVMFVYGGCTHNDSNRSTGALCFSPSFMAYYLACDTWEHITSPDQNYNANRYGHTSVMVNNMKESGAPRMLIYGGYDSTILGNIISYQMGSCSAFGTNETECTGKHTTGISCIWNGTYCTPAVDSLTSGITSCNHLANSSSSYCSSIKSPSCSSCLNERADCAYCDSKCVDYPTVCNVKNASACPATDDMDTYCKRFRFCSQCDLTGICKWDVTGKIPECIYSTDNSTSKCNAKTSCGSVSNCSQCRSGCMWCVNKQLCVSTISYVVQFPYGECMEWLNKVDQCPVSPGCGSHSTCDTCQTDPFCGWCDDGSVTGLGTCQNGASSGPVLNGTSLNVITANYNSSAESCSDKSWFYTDCPLCQCNGHSKCKANTSVCISCQDKTKGNQCQECIDGYFGDATNGGTCELCDCNGRADLCNNTQGICYCSTKGETGDKCEKCDTAGKYYGDPANNGTCFYRLLINYSFTFTLTPDHDKYVTAINFENTPPLDGNAELTFESQSPCNVRLTVFYRQKVMTNTNATQVKSSGDSEQYEEHEHEVREYDDIQKFSFDFSGSRYGFGNAETNATIRIYVSNITVPISIKIALVQSSNKLLVLLLILFSCFLVLLLLTAVVWKLKILYDACQHRRQHAEQLQQMAARPFSTVQLCFDDIYSPKKTPNEAIPLLPAGIDAVSEEQSEDGSASVVSVIFWMPTGTLYTGSLHSIDENKSLNSFADGPTDNCALAIGTTLLSSSNKKQPTQQERNDTATISRSEKLKVVFKRAARRPTSDASSTSAQQDNCGAQYNESNNRVINIEEERQGAKSPTTWQSTSPGSETSTHRRPSKRGRSSFTSIRSGSISPESRLDDNIRFGTSEPSLSPANNINTQPRPQPIVLAYNVPNNEKLEVTV